MVSPLEEGRLKESRYSDTIIIIRDSTSHKFLPPQLNNMTFQYKVMCDCGFCISSNNMYSYLLTWHDCHLKHIKYRSHNAQNRRSGEM